MIRWSFICLIRISHVMKNHSKLTSLILSDSSFVAGMCVVSDSCRGTYYHNLETA